MLHFTPDINAFVGVEALLQARKQCIPAGILGSRIFGPLILIDVPVLAPRICVPFPDHVGKLLQLVHNEGRKVTGIGGRAAIQSLADLFDSGVAKVGVAANNPLGILSLR